MIAYDEQPSGAVYVHKTYAQESVPHERNAKCSGAPYYKSWVGFLATDKSAAVSGWVQWVHQNRGESHCETCLKLDGCWFLETKKPPWPHHPYCHCILEPLPYDKVQKEAFAVSDYSKFDPYLFNTTGGYTHTKEKLFAQWGYTVADAKWLQQEMEKQALEQYVKGEYTLGKLNEHGQRINAVIEIPRRDKEGTVRFISGWMICPNGKIKLNTPYGRGSL